MKRMRNMRSISLILVIVFIALLPNAYAKYISSDRADENARISIFNVNMSSDEAQNTDINEIYFENSEGEKEFSFYIRNDGEAAVNIKAFVEGENIPEERFPEFMTDNEFCLFPNEATTVILKVFGSNAYGIFDLQTDFRLNVSATQL